MCSTAGRSRSSSWCSRCWSCRSRRARRSPRGPTAALDSQRLNLREERVAVREAQARVADDYRQRGVDGPELATLTGTALGAFAKAESVARGFQDGLKFLSLTMLGIGLPLAVLRFFTPPRQKLIPDPVSRTGAGVDTRADCTHVEDRLQQRPT